MSGASEFSGVCDFAMGSVKGVRSFDVDKLGRLTGVSFKKVWLPGENQSQCYKSETKYGINLSALMFPSYSYTLNSVTGLVTMGPENTPVEDMEKAEKKPAPPHSMATCQCGFYAYYDGSDDYRQSDRISAVVEGYGETLIGTRGFRAGKARILALRIRKDVPIGIAAKIRHNYPEASFFDSFKEMVAEFPPDAASGPDPETDDDFWTRSIA